MSNRLTGFGIYTYYTFIPILIFSIAIIVLNIIYGKSKSLIIKVISVLAPFVISLLFIHEIHLVPLGYSGDMNLQGLFVFMLTVPSYLIMEGISIVNIKN